MTDQIMPGERRELRSVVRQQMRVLRAEVAQREIELVSDVEARLVERYREEDGRADELGWKMREITDKANTDLRALLRQYEDLSDGGKWQGMLSGFSAPRIYRRQEDRDQLRKALIAGIKVQVKQAVLALDRQEADLLRELAMDGLETSAARAFLGRIPTVAELVPSKRLREIETAFDQGRTP